MGFLDKMKQMANAVTGGGAKVSVQVGQAAHGEAIPVTITAVISEGANLDVSSVYVLLRGAEIMKIDPNKALKRYQAQMGGAADLFRHGKLIEHTEESFSMRVDIAGAQTLEKGQTVTFEGEVRLPPTAPPSFEGKHIRHVIQIQGALDAAGNDPDSGWQDLRIS